MTLEQYRKELDKIDTELLTLIKKRLDLVKDIADYKKEHNMAIYQPEREHALFDAREKQAEDIGLNPTFATAFFIQLVGESKRIQEEHLGK